MPGSKSAAGKRIVGIGTWENQIIPLGSPREAEEAGKGYDDLVVGLIHSRGVSRVMPVEDANPLEGISSLT